jgi:hypothetical protein
MPAGEQMIESDLVTSEAISTIAGLLAAAYRRYLAANRLQTLSEPVNGELDNGHVSSPHTE